MKNALITLIQLFSCSRCIPTYIGYDTDCGMLCVHGHANPAGESNITKLLPMFKYL